MTSGSRSLWNGWSKSATILCRLPQGNSYGRDTVEENERLSVAKENGSGWEQEHENKKRSNQILSDL